jgi:radical SAM/Cys-rich protein
MQSFQDSLGEIGRWPLRACEIETLQVNLGKRCNQACRHCHVGAGPTRTEVMNAETAELVIEVLHRHAIPHLDLTGGAAELNPNFDELVRQVRALGRRVTVRSNLTVFQLPGKEYLAEFLRDQGVEIVASLPCYLEENVDAQRGKGVYAQSISALQRLNQLGFGKPDTGLKLSLVYNPLGPSLPPPQSQLEEAYHAQLRDRFGIVFNELYTITNMPINRFRDALTRDETYERYMELLVQNFNPATVNDLMCRTLISVGWNGTLYDCDFNQMLDLTTAAGVPRHLRDFDAAALAHREIRTAPHCFGCTAGSGSSCAGALADDHRHVLQPA